MSNLAYKQTKTWSEKEYFTSQADAERAAREALWGSVPYSQREMLYPEPGEPGAYGIYVSANVNGRLVVFEFDCYGRRQAKPKVL